MSTTTNFWELLQQRQDELTKSGRAVADYLVHHADEAQYLSISSLARECKVAEATVFRFCRALGFEGYHEMRISLAQANATGALVNQHEPEPGATTASLCEHASGLFLTAINGTQNSLSPEAVEQAVDLMRAARQVFCLGQGGSMLLANDICARFSSLSNKFRTAGDSHLQILAASLMGPCQRRFQEGCYLQASVAQFHDPHRHHHGNAPGFHGGLHRPDREPVRHPGSWQRDDERHQQP